MAHIRLGKKDDERNPLIKDFVPLAGLDDLVFGGWDPITPNALEGALQEFLGRDLAALFPLSWKASSQWTPCLTRDGSKSLTEPGQSSWIQN